MTECRPGRHSVAAEVPMARWHRRCRASRPECPAGSETVVQTSETSCPRVGLDGFWLSPLPGECCDRIDGGNHEPGIVD